MQILRDDFTFGLFDDLDERKREKIKVFNRVKLFENANRNDLLSIASKAEFQSMEKGERLIQKGDGGDGLFMIDSGEVVIRLSNNSIVAELERGEYFGEMALLERKPRSANVDCVKSGTLLKLTRSGFQELLSKHHQTSSKFLFVLARTLSNRLREMNEEKL